jgi:hypothetical protein
MKIVINKTGTVQFVYNESVLGMLDKTDNDKRIRRASQVEPDQIHPGEWYADLTKSGGPILKGFKKRSDAIKAEIDWLNDNNFGGINAN